MDDAAEGLRMTSFSNWFKGYAGACSLEWLDVWCDSCFCSLEPSSSAELSHPQAPLRSGDTETACKTPCLCLSPGWARMTQEYSTSAIVMFSRSWIYFFQWAQGDFGSSISITRDIIKDWKFSNTLGKCIRKLDSGIALS